EYGHRDVDSLFWYCEDCWLTFCGRRRRCGLCRVLKDEGHVDQAGFTPPLGTGEDRSLALEVDHDHAPVAKERGVPGVSSVQRYDEVQGFKKEFKPYHATSVPKETDFAAVATSDNPPTTAMLRNIPSKCTQASLLEEIDSEGFTGLYDFFYLPMDVRNKTNVGYAFVNFLQPSDMTRFSEHFEGYRFKNNQSQKIATVSPAHVQGLKRNVQQLSKKAVLHFNKGQYKPVVFRNGEKVDFEVLAKEFA
ncbi:ML2, partial [Symbiodinium pilosum]